MSARWLVAVSVALITQLSHAQSNQYEWQYQWKDESGRMVYSDRPPPVGTPASNVVRAPVAFGAQSAARAPRAEPKSGQSPNNKGNIAQAGKPASSADRELEARKKALEKTDADKRKAEEGPSQEEIQKSCEHNKLVVKGLETNGRITKMNDNGEREFLSDDEIAHRLAEAKNSVEEVCSKLSR